MADDIRYFLNEPIEIEKLGVSKAFTILESQKYSKLLNLLHIQTAHYLLENLEDSEKDRRKWILANMKNWDIICTMPEVFLKFIELMCVSFNIDMKNVNIWGYEERFNDFSNNLKDKKIKQDEAVIVLGKNVAVKFNDYIVTRNNYDFLRDFLINLNCLRFPLVGKTKEVQAHYEKSRKTKSSQLKENFEDTLSTICVKCGWKPWEMKEFTMYQVNMLIARIDKFKNYDTQVQYLCAGADPKEVKIVPYYSHVEVVLEEKMSESVDAFQKKLGFIPTH